MLLQRTTVTVKSISYTKAVKMAHIDKENIEKQLIILSPPKSFDRMLEKSHSSGTAPPTVVCSKFQDSLRLEFGYVTIGSTNKRAISFVNPNKSDGISISVDRVPGKHGISIVLDGAAADGSLAIGPGATASGTVFWIPLIDMSIREIITFKMNDKAPLQIIIYGTAGVGNIAAPLKVYHRYLFRKQINKLD